MIKLVTPTIVHTLSSILNMHTHRGMTLSCDSTQTYLSSSGPPLLLDD